MTMVCLPERCRAVSSSTKEQSVLFSVTFSAGTLLQVHINEEPDQWDGASDPPHPRRSTTGTAGDLWGIM